MKDTNKIKDLLDTMGSASIINRAKVADYIIAKQELFPKLIDVAFETEYKLHHKAAWILEFVLNDNLEWIIPHLDFFTSNLQKLNNQSVIRPASKICKWIAIAFDKNTVFKQQLTQTHIENMIEAGFDWLIGDNKVATQAYSMHFLYLLGKQKITRFDWVHQELKKIISQNMPTASSGYKGQGKYVLKMIK